MRRLLAWHGFNSGCRSPFEDRGWRISSTPGLSNIKLGLAGSHQYQNVNLAVALTKRFLAGQMAPGHGEATKWTGHCQTVIDRKHEETTWFLDGRHLLENLDCCIQWYVSPAIALRFPESFSRSKHGRAEEAGALFDQVIFCANVTYADGNFKGDLTMKALSDDELLHLKTQHELADAWSASPPSYLKDNIHVLPSIERAVNIVWKLEVFGEKPVVLVVGSLRGVIEVSGLSDVAL
ncbi:hypothetical protein LXA43DRAFT_1135851 [Ganoderma leucocontextum]|nr:hypothetical protein LXA43DRAFT_1135851 [Ganoderma leucocontextum]